MRKISSKQILFLLLIASMYWNCNKSSVSEKPATVSENAFRPSCIGCMSITVKTNPLNVYDTAGQRHNSGCGYVEGVINPASTTVMADNLHYTKQFLSIEHYDTTQYNTTYSYMTTNNYYALPDSFYARHPDSLYNRLNRNGLISTLQKHYLNLMDSAINTYIGSNSPTQAIYDTAAAHLILIEGTIIGDGTLTTAQKQMLLSTASIYRYSYAMWGTYILGNGFFSKLWKWFGKSDANGAIAGGTAAAITGAGIIIGAIGGAISASIANWLVPM